MSELFLKHTSPTDTVYTLDSEPHVLKIGKFKDYKPEDIESLYEDGARDFVAFGSEWFRYYKPTKSSQEKVTLPQGLYSHIPGGYGEQEKLISAKQRDGEFYVHIPEIQILLEDIHNFYGAKSVFDELGFLYRRNYLLYGNPGNGKSTLIHNLIKDDLFKSAIIIYLKAIPSKSLLDALNITPGLKVFIFEEISSQDEQVQFSVSDLLNFLDGYNTIPNSMVIATTNYPETLAANLTNRPGRFDIVFEIGNPPKDRAYELISKFLKRDVVDTEVSLESLSIAQLKELCLLHKLFKISLVEAQNKLLDQQNRFKRGFEEKKSFGLMND